MKKLFKIAGIALLSLIGLLLTIFLLARFVFREQAIDYLTGLEKQQRVELLRAAALTPADTVQYRFTYIQDTVPRPSEIREYFRLDTLVNPRRRRPGTTPARWRSSSPGTFPTPIRKSSPKRATQSDCGSIPVP